MQRTVGVDGLVEFGDYLITLRQPGYRHYTFEMPDGTGTCVACPLDDVLRHFQDFCGRKTDAFTVVIGYADYQQGMIGRTERKFTRRKG